MRDPRRTDSRIAPGDRRSSRRALIQRAAAMGLAGGPASLLTQPAHGHAATPASATPSPAGQRSIPRAEYLAALRQHFAIEPPRVRGGHAVMVIEGDPHTLNPIVATDAFSGMVLGNLFSALVGPSPIDGSWVPDLADSWDVSADGTVYVFRLNPGARWHDGQPVTAHDCVFTLDAVLDERSLSGIQSEVVKVVRSYRAVDDQTFELVGRQPMALLIDKSVGGLSIVPRHIWESVPLTEWGSDPGATGADPARVVGSGPFRFGEWVLGDHVSIVRNDDYWVPELVPYLDTFSWQVFPDTGASLISLEVGVTDICSVPEGQLEGFRASHPELIYTIFDNLGWVDFTMNGDPERDSFFVDARVRQAMLYALDRDLIVESILNGVGVRADGIYPPSSRGYAPGRVTTIYDHDPERARALLDAAGWTSEGGDGVREQDGVAFRTEIFYAEAGPNARQVVTYLQQAWRDVGADIQPTAIPFQVLVERQDEGDFELTLIGWGGFLDDQGLLYRCDAFPPHGFNMARICNPEFDRLNDASLVELDPVKRRELLIAQGNAANDIAHLGLLFFNKSVLAHHPRVRNLVVSAHAPFSWLPWVWLTDDD
jgi:peptide/nickel transport system substrate-binding protein